MANYRRLISYIYAYEGEVKGKNIGFAKLEARNGQCKIQVSVRKVYIGSQDIGVYLLTGGSEIFLGRMFVRGGNGEFRATVSYGNVAGSGQTIDQCYGLAIHGTEDSWHSYMTIWEDAVAHAAEVDLSEATSEKAQEREMSQIPGPEISERKIEEVISGHRPSAAEIIEDEMESQWHGIPPLQSGDTVEQEPLKSDQPQFKLEENDQPQPAESDQPQPQPAESDQPQTLPQEPEEQETASEAEKLWRHFQRHYPKIQAFDYKGLCEILLIKPQDIGLLPREVWNYGNNSFLLHGYYNYRYLILSRLVAETGEARFLLGVPGHYYSNEKYMAAMFGFPNFVLSKMQPANDGRFGYWYTDIRLDS